MAVTGPAPKQSKRRQNPDTFAWISVANRPFGGISPELDASVWPDATLAWWETIRQMPHCVLWSKSDWEFALETAAIHAAFQQGDLKQAPELRLRAAKMGITYEDRMKLRIRYVDEEEPAAESKKSKSGKVTSIDSRRKRLTGG